MARRGSISRQARIAFSACPVDLETRTEMTARFAARAVLFGAAAASIVALAGVMWMLAQGVAGIATLTGIVATVLLGRFIWPGMLLWTSSRSKGTSDAAAPRLEDALIEAESMDNRVLLEKALNEFWAALGVVWAASGDMLTTQANDAPVYRAILAAGQLQTLLRLLCNADFAAVSECRALVHQIWLRLNKLAASEGDAIERLRACRAVLDEFRSELVEFRPRCSSIIADWDLLKRPQ